MRPIASLQGPGRYGSRHDLDTPEEEGELEKGEIPEQEEQAWVVHVFRHEELPALIGKSLKAIIMPTGLQAEEEVLEDPLL